jgi:hypothetical protein
MLRRYWLLVLAASIGVAGCHADGSFMRPSWFHPGTVQQQRIRATVHDPYPDQDKGPAFVDGRPRDYKNALPEPVRSRIYADSAWGP